MKIKRKIRGKGIFQILLFFFIIPSLFSQRHDQIWISASSSFSSNNKVDFTNDEIQIDTFYPNIYSETSLITIADTAGNLQFITNGFYINDSTLQTMDNGDGLNLNLLPQGWQGHPLPQGYIVLPTPGKPVNSHYTLLHFYIDINSSSYPYFFATQLRATTINMSLNNGLGAVDEKNEVVLEADFDGVALTAVQHGNGRDWWIVAPGRYSNIFYRFLLDPSGIHFDGTQPVDSTFYQGLAQGWFTPDGERLAIYCLTNRYNVPNAQFLDIYDFDRCTGLLSNHLRITDNQGSVSGGMAISPNSRFLYVGNTSKIWQYDLNTSDILSSKTLIGEYDGYVTPNAGLPIDFNHFYLAPDNTIWISSTNSDSFERYHRIENPNEKGLGCSLVQHSIELPGLAGWSFPNHPNYTLGPTLCSSCDTLGNSLLPEIVSQPVDLILCEGQKDSFTIISNSLLNQYQWQILDSNSGEFIDLLANENIEGVTDSLLIVSSDAFQYYPQFFRCLVMDTCTNYIISDTVKIKEVISNYYVQIDSSFCKGDSIELHDSFISAPGEYTFKFETENGCDSLISYSISELEPNLTEIDTIVFIDSFFMGVQITSDTILQVRFKNLFGCDSLVSFNISAKRTSLKELDLSDELKIFPNPNSGAFNVILPNSGGGILELNNLLGRRFWQTKVNKGLNRLEVQLERIPKGYYFLKYYQRNKVVRGFLVLIQ